MKNGFWFSRDVTESPEFRRRKSSSFSLCEKKSNFVAKRTNCNTFCLLELNECLNRFIIHVYAKITLFFLTKRINVWTDNPKNVLKCVLWFSMKLLRSIVNYHKKSHLILFLLLFVFLLQKLYGDNKYKIDFQWQWLITQ